MATQYFIAPNARWQGRDQTGQPAAFGKLYTYEAGTDVPKTTWEDYEAKVENTNPVELDAAGEANIYWSDNELYKIVLKDADDVEIWTQDNYPVTDATSINPTPNLGSSKNFIRNPQFTFASNTSSFPAFTQSQNTYDYLLDDWLFYRSNTTATININQELFTLGQTAVPANPIGYLHYDCGDATGASETYKRFQQNYDSVQTLSGQTIVVSIWAQSLTGSTISISAIQNFGTGGTPSANVETSILTANLTSTWARYTASVTLPSVSGKTLGSNDDDILSLSINMPLNTFSTYIDVCNVQLQEGTTISDFPIESQEQFFLRLQSRVEFSLFRTSDFKQTLRSVSDPGWVLCDDGTMGNSLSGATHAYIATKALYELIWAGFANTYAPIFNSDGTVGTRGSTAEADYNAAKRLALTKTVGRVLATAGQAELTAIFTADSTTELLTIPDASSFYTGTPVVVSTTGTLPAPLVAVTTYYVIYISGTTIKLATTLANAVAGTAIDITTNGTGTNTIAIEYSNWVPGQFIGETQHASTLGETASHVHGPGLVTNEPGSDVHMTTSTLNTRVGNTDLAGGSQAHNNMQPTVFVYTMIKL